MHELQLCVFVWWDGLAGLTLAHGCELCMVSVKGGQETGREGERERRGREEE